MQSVAEKLIAEGKASTELIANYNQVLEMRQTVISGGELPKGVPDFVKEHRKAIKRMDTRERVRNHREKKRNAKCYE